MNFNPPDSHRDRLQELLLRLADVRHQLEFADSWRADALEDERRRLEAELRNLQQGRP
jgi:hypothetical protein